MLNTIDEGIKAVRQGKIVIVVDDANRENEGDFIVSGEKITPDIVNFMITHGRGLLCVPLPRSRCEAVSYTHLDVYKRQISYNNHFIQSLAIFLQYNIHSTCNGFLFLGHIPDIRKDNSGTLAR